MSIETKEDTGNAWFTWYRNGVVGQACGFVFMHWSKSDEARCIFKRKLTMEDYEKIKSRLTEMREEQPGRNLTGLDAAATLWPNPLAVEASTEPGRC